MVGWFSKMVVATTVRMPRWFVRWVSRRYVAGASLEEAVTVMKRLTSEGACFSIDVLGEEIAKERLLYKEADATVKELVKWLDVIS